MCEYCAYRTHTMYSLKNYYYIKLLFDYYYYYYRSSIIYVWVLRIRDSYKTYTEEPCQPGAPQDQVGTLSFSDLPHTSAEQIGLSTAEHWHLTSYFDFWPWSRPLALLTFDLWSFLFFLVVLLEGHAQRTEIKKEKKIEKKQKQIFRNKK